MAKKEKSEYDSFTKDELLDEVKRRNKEGADIKLDGNSTKADIVAALELHDEANSPENPVNLLPAGDGSSLPGGKVDLAAQAPTVAEMVANGKKFVDIETKEEFLVVQHAPDLYGRTFTAMNKDKTWQGQETDFRLKFEKP